MGAVWMRARAEFRSSWRTWLVLAALIGLAGGVAIAAVAGARRTATAFSTSMSRPLLSSMRPISRPGSFHPGSIRRVRWTRSPICPRCSHGPASTS